MEALEATPIYGDALSNRDLFADAHQLIISRETSHAVKLRALAVIDKATGGNGTVNDLDLANYLEETT